MTLLTRESLDESLERLEYNGFVFPQVITAKFSAEPVESSSGRTVRHYRCTLTIQTILTQENFNDSVDYGSENTEALFGSGATELVSGDRLDLVTFPLMQKILARGKRLVIHGLGIGLVDIDPESTRSSAIPDLANGPKPAVLDCSGFINGRAYHLTWQVVFHYNPCTEEEVSKRDPTIDAFDFNMQYAINESGMITRTISGRITVPNWIRNGQQAINIDRTNNDSLRKKLSDSFPVPLNFQRTQRYLTNEARTELTFTFIDSEIPSNNPYPENIVRISCEHTVAPSGIGALGGFDLPIQMDITLTGTIEVKPGMPKSWAWIAIQLLVRDRLFPAQSTSDTINSRSTVAALSFSLSESIFERTVTFAFRVKESFSLRDFWKRTRLFQPLNTSGTGSTDLLSWEKWNESMKDARNPYGWQGEDTFDPNSQNDYVVSVCDQDKLPENEVGTEVHIDAEITDKELPPLRNALSTQVTKASSYLEWSNRSYVLSDFNIAVPSVIGNGDAENAQADTLNTPFDDQESIAKKDQILFDRSVVSTNTPNTIQVRGTGHHYVCIKGHAKRVQYPVTIPDVRTVDGNSSERLPYPVLVQDRTQPSQVVGYTVDGYAIYEATWERVYCLPNLGTTKVALGNLPVQFQTPDQEYFRLT